MELIRPIFMKLWEILSYQIVIGSVKFTIFQLQCSFAAIAIIGTFFYGVFADD